MKRGLIKAIIFDLNGTLVPRNKYVHRVLQGLIIFEAAKKFELNVTDLAAAFYKNYTKYKNNTKSLEKATNKTYTECRIITRQAANKLKPYFKRKIPGSIIKMLRYITQKRVKLYLVTNDTPKTLKTIPNFNEIKDLFIKIFTINGKDKTPVFQQIIKENTYELSKNNILVIGDSHLDDFIPAQKLGIPAILIKTFKPAPKDVQTVTIKKLPSFIRNLI